MQEDILTTWKAEGGLMTIQMAADIIGVSQPAISQAINKKKIHSYNFNKKRLISFQDVLIYKAKRDEILLRAEIFDKGETLRRENPEAYKKFLDEQNNIRHELERKEEYEEYLRDEGIYEVDPETEEEARYEQLRKEHLENELEKLILEQENIESVIGGISKKFTLKEQLKENYKDIKSEEEIEEIYQKLKEKET